MMEAPSLGSSSSAAHPCTNFQLTTATRDALLRVISGLCREGEPLAFDEAEQYLMMANLVPGLFGREEEF
jgi:hypothetical protein